MKNTILLISLVLTTGLIYCQQNNYSIKNLKVNTEYSDFGVTYYGDSTAIYASSKNKKSIRNRLWHENRQPYLELYSGTLTKEGEIEESLNFSDAINSKYHESSVTFTRDLKTVYFSRNNSIDGKQVKRDATGWVLIQLYKATIDENGNWHDITPMPFNSDNYQTGHPSLNKAEDKLYFTSDMPGGFGKTDIYQVAINSDGAYGTPENLGSKINTEKREMFPFIAANEILYFSSDGHIPNSGQLDIYGTKQMENGEYSEIKNLGFPINSESDDFNLVYKSGDKKVGHFSSNRKGGNGDDDIYYFTEKKPLTFECTQLITGTVTNIKLGVLIPESLVVLYDQQGEELDRVITGKEAVYSFAIPCSKDYSVEGSKEKYESDSEAFYVKSGEDLVIPLQLKEEEFVVDREKMMININPIYFDLDKHFIRSDASLELTKVLNIMNKYPDIRVELGSHTDCRASQKYNWALSDRRATSSKEWLVKSGIDADRITGKGYGETQPVNKCSDGVKCTEAEHEQNRRTEFLIVNPEVLE